MVDDGKSGKTSRVNSVGDMYRLFTPNLDGAINEKREEELSNDIELEDFGEWAKTTTGIMFRDSWPAVEKVVRAMMGDDLSPFDSARLEGIYRTVEPLYGDLLEVYAKRSASDQATTLGRGGGDGAASPAGGMQGPSTVHASFSTSDNNEPSTDDLLGRYELPGEIAVRLVAVLREAEDDERRKQRILIEACAPVLRRLESRSDVKAEQLIDVVVVLLRRLRFNDNSTARGVCTLIPYLRPILQRDIAKVAPSSGWLKTLAALATLLTQGALATTDQRRRIIAGLYYNEILVQAATRFNAVDSNELVEQAANNLSAMVADLLQRKNEAISDERQVAAADVVKTLREISIGVSAKSGRSPDIEMVGNIFQSFGITLAKNEVGAFAEYIDRQKMVGSDQTISFESGISYALTGLGRAMLNISDRTAAGFFNAGVSLHRVITRKREEVGEPLLVRKIEIAFYALGLSWALRLNETLGEAMDDGDGLDCAINLISTAMELKDDQQLMKLISTLVLDLDAALSGVDGISPGKVARVRLALERLKLNAKPSIPGAISQEMLTKDADAVIGHILSVLAEGATDASYAVTWEKGTLDETTAALRILFNRLAPSGDPLEKVAGTLLADFRQVASVQSGEELMKKLFTADYMEGKVFTTLVTSGLIEESELKECFKEAYRQKAYIDEAIRMAFGSDTAHQPAA